jgi:hypothetical protein
MFSRAVGADNPIRFDRKSGAHRGPRNVKKKSAGDDDTNQALNGPAGENVSKIPHNLSSDYGHSQLPSPAAAPEPTSGGECKGHGKRQKQNANSPAQWRELGVSAWIQSPDAVEKCAGGYQGSSCK